jgi:hypothetical protein
VDLRVEARDDEATLQVHGLEFLHLPTADCCAIAPRMIDDGVEWVRARLDGGTRVLIHCECGVGRSALLALCTLVAGGTEPLDAMNRLKAARPVVSPAPEQLEAFRTWVGAGGTGLARASRYRASRLWPGSPTPTSARRDERLRRPRRGLRRARAAASRPFPSGILAWPISRPCVAIGLGWPAPVGSAPDWPGEPGQRSLSWSSPEWAGRRVAQGAGDPMVGLSTHLGLSNLGALGMARSSQPQGGPLQNSEVC